MTDKIQVCFGVFIQNCSSPSSLLYIVGRAGVSERRTMFVWNVCVYQFMLGSWFICLRVLEIFSLMQHFRYVCLMQGRNSISNFFGLLPSLSICLSFAYSVSICVASYLPPRLFPQYTRIENDYIIFPHSPKRNDFKLNNVLPSHFTFYCYRARIWANEKEPAPGKR